MVRRRRRNIKEWPPSNESGLFLRTFQSTMISRFPSLASLKQVTLPPAPHLRKLTQRCVGRKSAAHKAVVKGSPALCLWTTVRSTNIQRLTFTPTVCLWVRLALSWRVHTADLVCVSLKNEICRMPSTTAAQPRATEYGHYTAE